MSGFGRFSIGTRSKLLWPFTVVISSREDEGFEPVVLSFCSEVNTLLDRIAHVLCQSARVPPTAPF